METDLADSALFDLTFFWLAVQPMVFVIIALVLILLIGSALVSGSEIAYFSLTPADLRSIAKENTPAGKRIGQLTEKPRKLLATILIGNNFINIAIVLLSNYVTKQLFPEEVAENIANQITGLFANASITISNASVVTVVQFLVTILGVTFLLVIFGEISPKIYANIHNISLAKMMSAPLLIMDRIFHPISNLFVSWSKNLEKRLARNQNLSIKEDLDHAIELTVRQDKNYEEEIDMLKSIIKFSEVTVTHIMKSRLDVIAIDESISFKELIKTVKESGYSRIPVYREDFDHIIGILYVKDLLTVLGNSPDYAWQDMIRDEVLYAPESKKINELLKEFQEKKMHMAIVVDEYGGTTGLVTLEDIMEEVIGEIKDEFDDKEEVEFIQVDDNNFIFEGRTMLNDACRIVGVDTTDIDPMRGDADTLAGLILQVTGQMPKINREITTPAFRLKVLSVSKRRIEKIQLSLMTT